MEERKFKVGDRVTVTFDVFNLYNDPGVIIADKSESNLGGAYLIEFDRYVKGHDGSCGKRNKSFGKDGHCYYIYPSSIKLLRDDWKVVIIPDGDKTLGRLYENGKVVKSVETKKHPDDEYSIEVATKTIMERFFPKKEEVKPEPKEPPFKVGDVVEMVEDYFSVPKGTRGVIAKVNFNDCVVDFKVRYDMTHDANILPGKTGLWVTPKRFKKVN